MAELNVINPTEVLKFIADPESIAENDLETLRDLTLQFPYCQAFHVAYASALKKHNRPEFPDYLGKSATFSPSREILHKFVIEPASISARKQLSNLPATELPPALPVSAGPLASPSVEEELETEAGAEQPEETESDSSQIDQSGPEDVASVSLAQEEAEPANQFAEAEPENTAEASEVALEAAFQLEAPAGQPGFDIETVIPDGELPFEETAVEDQEQEKPATPDIEPAAAGPVPEKFPAEEKMIVGSIASSDYFVFDKSAVDPLKGEKTEEKPALIQLAEQRDDKEEISKYHDDTLPYTFLWWLHKTRKEYAHTYQPYVVMPATRLKKDVEATLNQQIIENIFHIQPELNTFPENASETAFELRKKEDEIIEKFIKEEPQIRPPQADKLDTENKARKSSEDNLDLVSETLAKIYIDQMLYHKAVDTYKKLSLKFPDKKLYFASQIEELEKKIN